MQLINRIKQTEQVSQLMSDWKQMLSPKYFLADLTAGITVALVAIPLSLAIALASGVSPGTGLITAIIAGIVCAIFGGTNLAVSGPAAAMSVLIASIVERHGLSTLIILCLMTGIMQLLSGLLGLGRFARYVPLPVIAGFTAGIGVIILIGQLPRAFGLMPPAESHIFEVFSHIGTYANQINLNCLLIVALTIAILRGLPKILPRLQPILPAVLITSAIVYSFHLKSVPLIGEIPRSLPYPQMPNLASIPFSELILNSFVIYLLASLETLLSSSAMDKISNNKKHNANQELIGQGLGNMAVSFFGGIPVTGVIARSVTNLRAGAKTRRASIIHSLVILLAVYAIAPLISLIPIATLAGILFSIAFSMINYHEFKDLWITSRSEGFIYVITFLTIIFVDLLAGVQAGIIAACAIVLVKAARTHAHVSASSQDDFLRFSLKGAVTFLAAGKIASIQKKIENATDHQIVLLDLSAITNLDSSGASAILDLYQYCKEHNRKFYIKGLSRRFEPLFAMYGGDENTFNECFIISEQELRHKNDIPVLISSHGRLVHGVNQFYSNRKYDDKRLFEFLKQKQDPHTLFITCSDSRLMPSLITSTDPGELFIVRNVGNCIPPYNQNQVFSEAAALDFSLNNLHITDVVICGHANCGAMMACCSHKEMPMLLTKWIDLIRSQLQISENMSYNDVARLNVLQQVENIKTYPVVRDKLAQGVIRIHAWFFEFEEGTVSEWNASSSRFESLIEKQVTA